MQVKLLKTFAAVALVSAMPVTVAAQDNVPLSDAEKQYVQYFDDACPKIYDRATVQAKKSSCADLLNRGTKVLTDAFEEVTKPSLFAILPGTMASRNSALKICRDALDLYQPTTNDAELQNITAGFGHCVEGINHTMEMGWAMNLNPLHLGMIYSEAKCLNRGLTPSAAGAKQCTAYKADRAQRLGLNQRPDFSFIIT